MFNFDGNETKLNTILEVVSTIVVIISLIFVGFEIHNSTKQTEQNTKALQVSAYQDLINRIVDLNMLSIEESVTIERLIENESRTENDVAKLNSFAWIIFRHGDMAYFQYEQGSISEARMRSAMGPLLGRLQHPYIQKRWNQAKDNFVPAYANYIDNYIREINNVSEKTN